MPPKREEYEIPDLLVEEFNFYFDKLNRIDSVNKELINGLITVIEVRYSKYEKL